MQPVSARHATDTLQPGDVLVVVHDFDSRSPDELTLRKAERVQLLELDDGFGDGWYLGRHLSRNATGLFPGVYTARLPQHLAAARPVLHTPPQLATTFVHSPAFPLVTPKSPPTTIDTVQALSPATSTSTSTTTPTTTTTPTGRTATNSVYVPPVQRGIGVESTVMNETLSVINEHITDLRTPRQSLAPPQSLGPNEDSGSDYSNYNYLEHSSSTATGGPDSDHGNEPQHQQQQQTLLRHQQQTAAGALPTKDEVASWDQHQVARHLRSIGVDPHHCAIFESQEITGEVLLDMDQSFIHMKDFDFGVMGRRLKTWHKIRDFQTQVRSRSRSNTIASPANGLNLLPSNGGHPALSTVRAPVTALATHTTPPSWRMSVGAESPQRPTTGTLRSPNPLHRHSLSQSSFDLAGASSVSSQPSAPNTGRLQSALDQDHTPPSAKFNATRPLLGGLEAEGMSPALGFVGSTGDVDLDRGYFSGNEVDRRKVRNTLKKRDSAGNAPTPGHSHQSSLVDSRSIGGSHHRHPSHPSRLSFVGSAAGDPSSSRPSPNPAAAAAVAGSSPLATIPAGTAAAAVTSSTAPLTKPSHRPMLKGRFRSASDRSHATQPSLINHLSPPTVTNLEHETRTVSGSASAAAAAATSAMAAFSRRTVPAKALKLIGFRSSSEAVGNSERYGLAGAGAGAGVGTGLGLGGRASGDGDEADDDEADTNTNNSPYTPSANSQSFDLDQNTDDSVSKAGSGSASGSAVARTSTGVGTTESQLGPMLSTRMPRNKGPKTKQQTSAYRRGLLKMSPAEARVHCDHSGWMKKKSPSLVTTWKPRLFILRGRRLSYYYDENDTEERGIIDISGHKVLAANSDPVLNLHATLTGAKSTEAKSPEASLSAPGSAAGTPSGSMGAASPASRAGGASDDHFYFKLVPPKAGFSRSVQFTKPTVHYFQCDSTAEGRKWMGEIMKATILHDLSSFETTNKQRTISLARARERRERPPALREDGKPSTVTVGGAATGAAATTLAEAEAEDDDDDAGPGPDLDADADEEDETNSHKAGAGAGAGTATTRSSGTAARASGTAARASGTASRASGTAARASASAAPDNTAADTANANTSAIPGAGAGLNIQGLDYGNELTKPAEATEPEPEPAPAPAPATQAQPEAKGAPSASRTSVT